MIKRIIKCITDTIYAKDPRWNTITFELPTTYIVPSKKKLKEKRVVRKDYRK